MKVQTYKTNFEAISKRGTFTVTGNGAAMETPESASDIFIRSSRSIGDVAHALLMVAIVGAHPVWVMWFLVALISW